MDSSITRRDALRRCAAALPAASLASAAPRRLTRAESFLGIHFDFHAGPDCKEVGKNTTPAMIEAIIDMVHPDYLQIDCKGHPGYSSYPTKVGNPAPGIIGDPLRLWREVTARRGVALYVHYSGVIDNHAAAKPGWAVVKADGKPHEGATSFFGPYVDQLMIPQLREIAGYGIDGIWIDGDCWGAVADYSEAALKAFRDETGIEDVPRKAGEPHWFEFLEFNRRAYRKYARHYITEVKKTNPEFQICSNWAYTDHMPEPVTLPVDFLSGDLDHQNAVNSARMAARYLARQGKTWDMMAWSFTIKPTRKPKNAAQLQREAAIVLASGGGFQAYFTQNRDGAVRVNELSVMAEVAQFCRARQALCHHAEPVPQIGVLFSTAAHYRRINGLFNRSHPQVDGILQALVESQHSVEVVSESQLQGRLSEYPLIVVPECEFLEPKFKDSLTDYARAGGNLLLIGPKTAALFATETPSMVKFGRGKIASILAQADREALSEIVRQLFPQPMVEVTGSQTVDVSVAGNKGKLLVHLINTSGPHRTESIVESIAPIGPLQVSIRLPKKPAKVTLEPSGQVPQSVWRDGQLTLTVPKLEIHQMVVVHS